MNAFTTLRRLTLLAPMLVVLVACNTTSTRSSGLSDDPFELTAQADFAYDRGDWLIAERFYEELTHIVPSDAYAFSRLGNIRLKQNNFEGAIHAYSTALEREPNDARTLYNLATAHLLLARGSLQQSLINLPENDAGIALVNAKLEHFEQLVYEPVIERRSPNAGLIRKRGR